MHAPTPAYRDLRRSFRRGEFAAVHARGDDVAVGLAADPAQRDLVPAAVLMHGAALAEMGQLAEAARYLGQGLDMLAGTRSERELGGGDWYALRLLEVLVVLGRFPEVLNRATALEAPDRKPETRLGAIRARVAVLTTRGELEPAWQFVNAATSLVGRIRSNLQVAMVDGDRAQLLAASGRLEEAVALADRVLARSARPGEGRQFSWAAAEAAGVALGLCRAAARTGDLPTATRMLATGAAAAERAGDRHLHAQHGLAEATVRRAQGDVAGAEAVGREVMQAFVQLGGLPGVAQTRLEEALLAVDRGMDGAAAPLLRLAAAELDDLGMRRDAAVARHHLARLEGTPDVAPHAAWARPER